MNAFWKSMSCFAALAIFVSGCQSQSPSSSETSANGSATDAEQDKTGQDLVDHQPEGDAESDVMLAMSQLSTSDRQEAEAQKFCAVMHTSQLGSMGVPLKLDVNGQAVFVCCAGCKSKAMKNPDETLAAVAKLKSENSSEDSSKDKSN